MKSSIIFLQETNLAKKILTESKQGGWDNFFFNLLYLPGKEMILVHKSVLFMLKDTDPSGRFIIFSGTIVSTQINLVTLYAPNGDVPSFYKNLFLTLSFYPDQCIQTRKTIKKNLI